MFAYAANNPVKYTDPDGNSVKNNTNDPVVVRTEHGNYVVLLKGDKYKGRQDGVLCPDGTTYKVFTLSNVKVRKDDNGNYKFSGGKIANALTNLIKGIINFLFGKEKDKNDVYSNKFPKGWWEGKKDFTDKDIGDKADKSKGTVFEYDVDPDSNLSEWWASIQKDVDKQIKTKLKADE